MASLQKIVISLLLMLTAGFLFLAQSAEATKGPKITNKVSFARLSPLPPIATQFLH